MKYKVYWHWNYWALDNCVRFNNGNPYMSYRFGPLEIRKVWRPK